MQRRIAKDFFTATRTQNFKNVKKADNNFCILEGGRAKKSATFAMRSFVLCAFVDVAIRSFVWCAFVDVATRFFVRSLVLLRDRSLVLLYVRSFGARSLMLLRVLSFVRWCCYAFVR